MSTVLDDSLLDDGARLVAADRLGALRAVATAGAQVRATWVAADDAGVPALRGLRPRAVVLLVRPGTGDAMMPIVATLLAPTSPVPILVAEIAPSWLGPLDVVVAAHRGRDADPTEVAIGESVHRAVRRGAHVVLTGPDEGPVAAAGAGGAITVVPRLSVGGPDPSAEPTADLDAPTVLAALLAVTTALDLLRVDHQALADLLDAEAERDGPRGEAFVNPAKTLALRLADRTPLLWGVGPVATAVASYGAGALATHAGIVAQATSLAAASGQPALHGRLGEESSEASVFADPFEDPPSAPSPRLVLVGVAEDVGTRRLAADAAARWPGADVLELDDVDATGDTPAATAVRAAVLAARFDFTALYLGLATGADTAPVHTG